MRKYFVTIPKKPGPAPRAAQKKSGFSVSLARIKSPWAVTSSIASRLSVP